MIILWSKLNARVKVRADVLQIFCIISLIISLCLFCFTCFIAITLTELDVSESLETAAYISAIACLAMVIWLPFYEVLNYIKKLKHWHLLVFIIVTFLSIILAIIPAIMVQDYKDEKYVKKIFLDDLRYSIINNEDVSTWVKFYENYKCCNWDEALDIVNLGDEAVAKIDSKIDDFEFLDTLSHCFEINNKNTSNITLHKDNTNGYHAESEQDKQTLTSVEGCKSSIMEEVASAFTGITSVAFVVAAISLVLIVTMLFYLYHALIPSQDQIVLIEESDKGPGTEVARAPSVKTLTAAEVLQAEAAMLKEGRRQSLRIAPPPKNVNFK